MKNKEEPWEVGGYFILNGKERCLRIQVVQKRNHPIALKKNFGGLSTEYTDLAINIRSIRKDNTGAPLYLHYKKNGDVDVRFWIGKQAFFVPASLLLKSLVDISDRGIYDKIVHGNNYHKTMDISEEVQTMIQLGKLHKQNDKLIYLETRNQYLKYLGDNFRHNIGAPDHFNNLQSGQFLLDNFILVHLDNNNNDKFNLFIFMLQKLYALAKNKIQPENLDSMINHEALLPGHLFQMLLKRKLQMSLIAIANEVKKVHNRGNTSNGTGNINGTNNSNNSNSKGIKNVEQLIKDISGRRFNDVAQQINSFLSTGNFADSFAVGIRETTGYSIIPERINYLRFMASFRSVHRGSSFQEQRTTSARKLLPETWGFLCPVHTPDGGPCGLLNHMATPCQVVTKRIDNSIKLKQLLSSMGMEDITQSGSSTEEHLTVLLDGVIIGKIASNLTTTIEKQLRLMKIKGIQEVPNTIEITLVNKVDFGLYPGLYLYTDVARFIRPVLHIASNLTEYIAPFEQIYMNIACTKDDIKKETTHSEINTMNLFSFIADLTPFSDFNQSPRNMYQCQMGKQTMGIPCYTFDYRCDKLYRIRTPQKPIVKTENYDKYNMDEYPNGTNAVVAVISYTGYDMEDGMIINKSSYERGFAHGSLYKIHDIDLKPKSRLEKQAQSFVTNTNEFDQLYTDKLESDGLPKVGSKIVKGDPLYCTLESNGSFHIHNYKINEDAYVDQVRVLENEEQGITKASIKLRYNRNPVIGDKFSSRHGQKGTLSRLWPQIDMPFTESGMTPDVIINPNAFPSRMTIGMLVESLAGKSGSCHAIYQDGTPFKFNEKNTAVQHFGEQLVKAGYNYYGNEPMYSGSTGQIFQADIYIGVVYYQRLRHMVKDKFQARATGPINKLHRQPLKGRKIGGGIRFGEMERDALLGHGASFLLHDRLVVNSDEHKCYICNLCGNILSPVHFSRTVSCLLCGTGRGMKVISLPFVVRYLAAELSAVNVKLTLQLDE